MSRRHKLTFNATDSGGKIHALHVFADIIDGRTRGNPTGEIEGMTQILTEDGQSVRRVAQGRYQVVDSGLELSSDDPHAP